MTRHCLISKSALVFVARYSSLTSLYFAFSVQLCLPCCCVCFFGAASPLRQLSLSPLSCWCIWLQTLFVAMLRRFFRSPLSGFSLCSSPPAFFCPCGFKAGGREFLLSSKQQTVALPNANRQNAANRGHWLNRCEERK